MRGKTRPHRRHGAREKAIAVGVFCAAAALVMAACGSGKGAGDTQDAGDLYARYCVACHGDAATGRGALMDVPVHSNAGHAWHHADGQLHDIIFGRLNVPGRKMPTYEGILTEAQVDSILSYLKSNWGPQERAHQEEVSRNWESIRD